MTYRIAGFILLPIVFAASAAAHHGWGSYDVSRKLTIEGPVRHLEWQNPHVHIQLAYENMTWQIVLAPVSRMQIRGLSSELIKAGTDVAAEGYPSLRNQREMRAERLRVGGKTYELR